MIGLAVKDQAKTSMASILVFLPSILFSGILFPAELLPEAFALVGNLFPATWGYRLLTGEAAACPAFGRCWSFCWPPRCCAYFCCAGRAAGSGESGPGGENTAPGQSKRGPPGRRCYMP